MGWFVFVVFVAYSLFFVVTFYTIVESWIWLLCDFFVIVQYRDCFDQHNVPISGVTRGEPGGAQPHHPQFELRNF